MAEINRLNNWNPDEDKLSEIKKQLELFQNNASKVNRPLNKNETIEGRYAKLIVLLVKIEEELNTLEKTLEKLWTTGYTNNNETVKHAASTNLETIKRLQLKIRKARLNLNYTFI
jgi:SpoU rRNA methylase family enzyme